jgi:uncharacterized protein (TIGR03032 family)
MDGPPQALPASVKEQGAPLRSVHSPNFPGLLEELGISLLLSTYHTGKLVFLRALGGRLNAHCRALPAPMGVALHEDRLAIGGPWSIWEFQNMPRAARQLEPAGLHDACFVPRLLHVTGNVQIHEMAWVKGELWFVNTRFSCLCSRTQQCPLEQCHIEGLRSSFVPRWRPPFVSALAAEDRCHLNGLAVADGHPRFVTALGATDTPDGWRATKRDGGVVLEVRSGAVVARGLSMPHSPRWYDGQLWLLESGRGGFGRVELSSGKYRPVAELPGYTRGLDFLGPFAFVGLSQARDTANFSDIPITEPARERHCGVWVLDLRSGQTVAWARFEDQLPEVFAVQVLPGMRFPELLNDGRHQLVADSFMLQDPPVKAPKDSGTGRL